MHRPVLAAAAIAATCAVASPARADGDLVATASGGVLYVDKQAAVPITGLSGAAEVSLGARVHPRALIKARLLGFRADGTNLALMLAGELDVISRAAGVSFAAGLSRGAESRGGNIASLGVYGRLPLGVGVAARLDAGLSTVARTDFLGVGASAQLGVEVSF